MGWTEVIYDISDLDVFIASSHAAMQLAERAKKNIELNRLYCEVMHQPDPYSDSAFLARAMDEAERAEKFAKRESENGYSYLYSIATTKLWSLLEHAIDRCALEWIGEPKVLNENEFLLTLNGPLVEFMRASDTARIAAIFQQLKAQTRAKLKPGVGRFEAILDPLGLGGPVPEYFRRDLLEFSEARNLIVHRRSIADVQFITRCPWLGISLGEEVRVSLEQYKKYQRATIWYVFEVGRRVNDASGDAPRKDILEALKTITERRLNQPGIS
jgi:hypothetical protein